MPGCFGKDTKSRAEVLTKQLSKRLLISSSRTQSAAVVEKNKGKLLSKKGSLDAGEFYKLADLVDEQPNGVSEIINAGWDTKLSEQVAFLQSVIGDAGYSFEEKFIRFGEFATSFDDKVRKSIETARVHKYLIS